MLPVVALPGAIHVVDWISAVQADAMPASFGAMSCGWFGFSDHAELHRHTWADYLDHVCEEDADARERAEALRSSIVERRIWRTGNWHLHNAHGVPMFSDATVASFTHRSWGDLLAAVWSSQLGQAYNYLDFYFGRPPTRPADFKERASRVIQPITRTET